MGDVAVLVVDDDFMVARIHTQFVERTPGFRVVGVASTSTSCSTRACSSLMSRCTLSPFA